MILSLRILFDLLMNATLLIAVNETCSRPQISEPLARVEKHQYLPEQGPLYQALKNIIRCIRQGHGG
ncbi:hypothetical protein C8R48DRAFT_699428 [Suillus tomentosus]|nr:hypothetical protein C8R48DRAFT_699428 [Suillus tomentosus]